MIMHTELSYQNNMRFRNVADFSPYLDDMPLENLRLNSLQQMEDDGDHSMGTSTLATPVQEIQFMV